MNVISWLFEGKIEDGAYCRVVIEGFAQRLELESCDLKILEVRGL
jgi:hypothetical protein